jgi:GT2 family glycosyltransferase
MYRRSDWNAVGGLDERFFCYVEDVDIGFRLQLAGRPCWYVPDAVAFHVGSASSGAGSPFAVYHGHRNIAWAFVKDMPSPLVWRYLPYHLAAALVALVWFTLRGRGRAIIGAKWHGLLGMRQAVRARRAVQAARTIAAADARALLDDSSLFVRLFASR